MAMGAIYPKKMKNVKTKNDCWEIEQRWKRKMKAIIQTQEIKRGSAEYAYVFGRKMAVNFLIKKKLGLQITWIYIQTLPYTILLKYLYTVPRGQQPPWQLKKGYTHHLTLELPQG